MTVLIKFSYYDNIRNDLFNIINVNDVNDVKVNELQPCQKTHYAIH